MLVTQDRFETLLLCHAMMTILVHFGAPHGRPHDPSMTGSDSSPLSSVHLTQKWIMLVTQDKFETLLLNHAMVTILVYFGPFWCTSWATPQPLHDWFWLLSPFKCPFNPEMDHDSYLGQIQNTLAQSCYGDYFGPFWSILMHLMGDPTTPPWLVLTSFLFQVSIQPRNGSC